MEPVRPRGRAGPSQWSWRRGLRFRPSPKAPRMEVCARCSRRADARPPVRPAALHAVPPSAGTKSSSRPLVPAPSPPPARRHGPISPRAGIIFNELGDLDGDFSSGTSRTAASALSDASTCKSVELYLARSTTEEVRRFAEMPPARAAAPPRAAAAPRPLPALGPFAVHSSCASRLVARGGPRARTTPLHTVTHRYTRYLPLRTGGSRAREAETR